MEKTEIEQAEELCNNLDELSLKQVDLVDEQLVLLSKMNNLLTNGFIDMAKSRYISGERTVSITQIPGEDSEIEAVTTVNRGYDNKMTVSRNPDSYDPIKWFGVLVPASLRQSQQAFQKALEMAVEIINTRREWQESIEEFKNLSTLKSST